MNEKFLETIRLTTSADRIQFADVIQELWSGYGFIGRFRILGARRGHVVVKYIRLPESSSHPRGWNTDYAHHRKLESYRVEQEWYDNWANRCTDSCKVPVCLATEVIGDEKLILMEDMDESGYPVRLNNASITEIVACIRWLANFHAVFMNCKPEGLWDQGTYWNLDTRPEELEMLDDIPLKKVASAIDKRLRESSFLTIIHGDAKLANFCFSLDREEVAAVDFQYVGGGCGIKDFAYFIGSCLSENEMEKQDGRLLDLYFEELRRALSACHPNLDCDSLESEWRKLYPYAIADFQRFLKGWSPGHWKSNSYTERVTRRVVRELNV